MSVMTHFNNQLNTYKPKIAISLKSALASGMRGHVILLNHGQL